MEVPALRKTCLTFRTLYSIIKMGTGTLWFRELNNRRLNILSAPYPYDCGLLSLLQRRCDEILHLGYPLRIQEFF